MRLTDRAAHRVWTFSGGMKQRLNLAAALLHDPPVLLLDEPTAALDPASRDALFADLTRFRDDGHAILLTTHHLDEAESGCDRVAVLDSGKLVACGPPSELLRASRPTAPCCTATCAMRPPKYLERAIRRRLGAGVELEVTGRRLRLSRRDERRPGPGARDAAGRGHRAGSVPHAGRGRWNGAMRGTGRLRDAGRE